MIMAEFINTCKLIHVCIHSIVKEQKTDFAKEDLATENAPLDDKFTIILGHAQILGDLE